MIKHNQDGAISGVAIALILAIVLLIGAIGFGVWAFSGRQDYKNNVDAKIAAAVTAAKQQESIIKDQQYTEAAKKPLRTYNGPEAYGSLVVNYPKTWSGYVDDSGSGNALVDGYFYPGIVPSIIAQTSVFALRVQVLGQSYSSVLSGFSGQQQAGQLTIAAYALPKVPKVVGVEVTGMISAGKNGTVVVLPLRDKTLEISTNGTAFLPDFNNNILPNFSFSP